MEFYGLRAAPNASRPTTERCAEVRCCSNWEWSIPFDVSTDGAGGRPKADLEIYKKSRSLGWPMADCRRAGCCQPGSWVTSWRGSMQRRGSEDALPVHGASTRLKRPTVAAARPPPLRWPPLAGQLPPACKCHTGLPSRIRCFVMLSVGLQNPRARTPAGSLGGAPAAGADARPPARPARCTRRICATR
jgi:hypothetical protein